MTTNNRGAVAQQPTLGMDYEELTQIQRRLGLTQRALARELECSVGAISNMSRTTEYAIRQLYAHGMELAPLTGAHAYRYASKSVMTLVKDLGLRGGDALTVLNASAKSLPRRVSMAVRYYLARKGIITWRQ